jgi:hypothetical protein
MSGIYEAYRCEECGHLISRHGPRGCEEMEIAAYNGITGEGAYAICGCQAHQFEPLTSSHVVSAAREGRVAENRPEDELSPGAEPPPLVAIAGQVYVPPNAAIDAEARWMDALEGVTRCPYTEGSVGRAERQRDEFRKVTPAIAVDDIVRARLRKQARREAFFENAWRRIKANAALFIACVVAGVALALFLCECAGWRP